ncbi:MAG: amidoligase family protein [Oscillibacter sp.]|nr:amidoligase family protein [Oscillibacter sp.]
MGEKICACGHCDRVFPLSELTYLDSQPLCESCLDEETVVCQDCGRRVWHDEDAGSDGHPLCSSCFDNNYTRCTACGRLLSYEDAEYAENDTEEENPYCANCCPDGGECGIRSYDFKPVPVFHGDGPRYLGVELEIDEGGESNENAAKIMDIGNAEAEHLYCKRDGSLQCGFEIVTHPCSLEYHLTKFPWPDVLRQAVRMGYTSHQAETCGLHVHVSRDSFGDTAFQQDAAIARVLYFFEKHWGELLKFSRRTQSQLERWAYRYGLKEHPIEILDHAKAGRSRYCCVNLTNRDTIEFRLFRGTLKLNNVLATLQFVNRVCDVAVSMSDQQMKDLSWTEFAAGCRERELVRYLKERRIFINAPVRSEAEV